MSASAPQPDAPSQPEASPAGWQQQLAGAVRSLPELLARVGLTAEQVPVSQTSGFAVLVPEDYLQRIRHGDPSDPLLLQVLPRAEESQSVPGWVADPLAESAALHGPGQLHKYRGRMLLVSTGACAIHCRYCFRRHFPYAEQHAGRDGWKAALTALRDNPDISELILSGGDPLTLANRRLESLVDGLHGLAHLRRLRLHTRVPCVLPARVDDGLCALLARAPVPVTVVLHVNHARELSPSVREACRRLRGTGATLLNQAVLLRRVNDTVDAQHALAEALFDTGVLPYYLHLMDPVAGAAHFDVPEAEAVGLVTALRNRLPGYLVPRLARERPGEPAKTVLA